MPSTMDLWIEGELGELSICFQQKIPFDMDRFQSDDIYAERVSTYIQTALGYLAEEVAEIGLMATPEVTNPTIDHPATWRALSQVEVG